MLHHLVFTFRLFTHLVTKRNTKISFDSMILESSGESCNEEIDYSEEEVRLIEEMMDESVRVLE